MGTASQESIGSRLATFLGDHRREITREWMMEVRRDQRIRASETVTFRQLQDHLPEILDCLSRVLQNAFDRELKDRVAENAGVHGRHRWSQGYDLGELMLELAHLRAVLIRYLVNFLEEHDEDGGAARLFAFTTLHRFLDDLVRESVEVFLKEQGLMVQTGCAPTADGLRVSPAV